MVHGRSKSTTFSKIVCQTFTRITVLTFFVTQLHCVNGIPINFANNNKNSYSENHANRPLPNQPPGPQQQRPPTPYQRQPQQNSQNQGPEMEDFGRLYTNQNQFRRHAMAPPAVKVTPGAFQHNPSEQFEKSGSASETGTNFRHNKFDESFQQHYSSHSFRHQPPSQNPHGHTEEDFYQRSQEQSNWHARRQSSEVPSPNLSGRVNNLHPEEAHFFAGNNPNQYHQQMLNDNEIFRGRKANSQVPFDERANMFTSQQRGKSPVGQWQQEQQPPHPSNVPNSFMEFSGQKPVFGKPNSIPVSSTMPQPTAVAIVVPGVDGNSTLFIEYDVSNNDITYETIVEVEDVPDTLVTSNHVY